MGQKCEETEIGPVFARFFSSSVIRELAHYGHSEIARRLAVQCGLIDRFGSDMKVRDFYDEIFNLMMKNHRYEYIYKNAIAEKILLGRHNLKTAFMHTEFRADNCVADVVVLNGTSHVYEIKTEMDSFDRLDNQLSAYKKIFDKIVIVTTEKLYSIVDLVIPEEIGIMVLAEGKYAFRKNPHREAVSNKANVDPLVIFSSLQRREYLTIINDHFGEYLNHLPNTQIYKVAKSFFKKLSSEEAHDYMVEALQKRRDTMKVVDFISNMPKSLKAASLSVKLTREERFRFLNLLDENISRAFH